MYAWPLPKDTCQAVPGKKIPNGTGLTLWDKLAERAGNQLHKGSHVLAEGKLMYRSYANDQGQTQYTTEIRVTGFVILDKKTGNANNTNPVAPAAAGREMQDDLPF